MGIDRASCDCWIAGKDDIEVIENPTWEDVEKMISSLYPPGKKVYLSEKRTTQPARMTSKYCSKLG